MPRIRSTKRVAASNVQATAYPETRTNAGAAPVTPDLMKQLMFQKPPRQDTWQRTRFGRGLNMDRIESALRGAQYGAMRDITDLARETVATDPHLAAVLSKRINAVASLPFDIVPAEGPGTDAAKAEANAELVRVQIGRIPHFRQALKQLAWALFDGRAALEIQWLLRPTDQAQKVGGAYDEPKQDWVAADLLWIHPRRLQFGPKRELRVSDEIVTTGFQAVGIALTDFPFKFVEFKPQLFGDYPELEGLSPRCLYWSFFKRFTARDRLILLELFGKPWRIVEFDNDANVGIEDLRDAEMAVDQLGDTTSARLPRGAHLEVVAPGKSAGEVHAEVIAESDKQISKLVLGQTGTTDAQNSGLGSNQPEVMAAEQLLILQGDAELLGDAIEDGLCDAIVALNRGVDELINAPRFILRAEVPTDRTKEAARVKGALDAGLAIAVDEAYEVVGFRKPTELDATLRIEDVAGPDGISTPRAIMRPPLKTESDDPEAGLGDLGPADDQAPPVPGAAPDGKGKFALVPADLVLMVLVNEARASAGLGPLLNADGTPNPDGFLTVAAFKAKHEAAKPVSPPGAPAAPGTPASAAAPAQEPKAGVKAFKMGDRVQVIPGKEHMPEHAGVAGTVKIVNEDDTYGVLFDGTSAVHKWYTGEELEPAKAPPPDKGDAGTGEAPPVPEPVKPKVPESKAPAGNLAAPLHLSRTVEEDLAEFVAGCTALSERFEQQLVDDMCGRVAAQCTHQGHTVALGKNVQPSTVHGTLEDIIDRGVREAARVTSKWSKSYVDAVAGKHTASAIHTALLRAHAGLELVGYARMVERRVSQATMAGALDSQWEGETDSEIKPEAFEAPEAKATRARLAIEDAAKGATTAGEVVEVSPEFTKMSYKAALNYFTNKAPIPKSTFAKLSASMKARSFTVAGLSSDASLKVAQDQLTRAIVEGSDLKEFSKQLGERFDQAGMTALNPSHVENVFRTNVLDTYNIGRRAEMSQPEVLKSRPYWLIRTVVDSRQRKTHGAVNNWVLRADDSFWSKGGPPWGYQCRCRVTSIREPRAKLLGIRSGAEILGLPDEDFTPNALVGSGLTDLLSA